MSFSPNEEPLPGYRLVKRLGRGGFGEAWEAINEAGLHVALKFLNLETGDAQVERKALMAVCNIRHPNLVPIHDIKSIDGFLVVVMTLCERNLLEHLKECQSQGHDGIPKDELLGYMTDVAKALDWLNEPRHLGAEGKLVGVQHRDVKPQNIFLQSNTAVLADFGLARIMERSVSSTKGSMTPAYAPPERFDGKVAANSDQWSLAVTYCHLATGRLPFQGPSFLDFLKQITCSEPALEDFPAAERAVLAKALDKESAERFASSRQFVDRLSAAVLLPAAVGANWSPGRGSAKHAAVPSHPATKPEQRSMSTPKVSAEDTPKSSQHWKHDGQRRNKTYLIPLIGLAVAAALALVALPFLPLGGTQGKGDAQQAGINAETTEPGPPPVKDDKKQSDAAKTPPDFAKTKRSDSPAPAPAPPRQVVFQLSVDPNDAKVIAVEEDVLIAGLGAVRTATVAKPNGQPRTLRASATGHIAADFALREQAEERSLRIRLKPEPARFALAIQPETATLEVDGAPVDRTGEGAWRSVVVQEPNGQNLTFRVRKQGFRDVVRRAVAKPGANEKIDLVLQPLQAVLKLAVRPPYAAVGSRDVRVNIVGSGSDRRVEVSLDPPTAEIELFATAPGHERWEKKIALESGGTQVVDVELDPLPALFTFVVEPRDAELALSNNHRIESKGGEWTARFRRGELNAEFTITARRAGHRTVERTFRPRPGMEETMQLSLSKIEPSKFLTLKSVDLEMALVPAGRFMAGSAESPEDVVRQFPSEFEPDFANEHPRHAVVIARPVYFGKTEVTVRQFRRFVEEEGYKTTAELALQQGEADAKNANPTGAANESDLRPWHRPAHDRVLDDHPVTHVSYVDALQFCQWLSAKEKRAIRLPLQLEWEYACRAGTTTRYWCGDEPESLLNNANVPDRSHVEQSGRGEKGRFDRYFFKFRVADFPAAPAPAAPAPAPALSNVAATEPVFDRPWLGWYGVESGVVLESGNLQKTVQVPVFTDGVKSMRTVVETVRGFRLVPGRAESGIAVVNTFPNPLEIRLREQVLTIPAGERREFEPVPENEGNTLAITGDDGYPGLAPVARFRANPFGLFDMHGNVWEWCQDPIQQYSSNPETVDFSSKFASAVAIPNARYVLRGGCFT